MAHAQRNAAATCVRIKPSLLDVPLKHKQAEHQTARTCQSSTGCAHMQLVCSCAKQSVHLCS